MKKSYVKPIMESEAFVANEYVANCWEAFCEGGHSIIVTKEPVFEYNIGQDDDGFVYLLGRTKAYYGTIEGCEGYQDYFNKTYHKITDVQLKGTGNSANAS